MLSMIRSIKWRISIFNARWVMIIYCFAWSQGSTASWEYNSYSLCTPREQIDCLREERIEEEFASRRLRVSRFLFCFLVAFQHFFPSYFQYQDHGHDKRTRIQLWEKLDGWKKSHKPDIRWWSLCDRFWDWLRGIFPEFGFDCNLE